MYSSDHFIIDARCSGTPRFFLSSSNENASETAYSKAYVMFIITLSEILCHAKLKSDCPRKGPGSWSIAVEDKFWKRPED